MSLAAATDTLARARAAYDAAMAREIAIEATATRRGGAPGYSAPGLGAAQWATLDALDIFDAAREAFVAAQHEAGCYPLPAPRTPKPYEGFCDDYTEHRANGIAARRQELFDDQFAYRDFGDWMDRASEAKRRAGACAAGADLRE